MQGQSAIRPLRATASDADAAASGASTWHRQAGSVVEPPLRIVANPLSGIGGSTIYGSVRFRFGAITIRSDRAGSGGKGHPEDPPNRRQLGGR